LVFSLVLTSCGAIKVPPTTIKIVVTSDPPGAVLMAGSTSDNLKLIGLTPITNTHTDSEPFWKAGCFKFSKFGYYDDLQCFDQSRINVNRYIHANLIPISKREETEPPKNKETAPEQKIVPAEPKNKSIVEKSKSGTGFFINTRGYFVSNEHVVKDCRKIEVVNLSVKSTAQALFSDSKNDIAVLKIEGSSPQQSSSFRIGKPIRAGDDIITVGFPLQEVLGSDIKVTKGNISSLTGVNNDSSMLQFSAPIQPGNSGGPLLDTGGNVVGIVSAKLSEIATLKATGTLPQNVNFAIKNQVIQTFLDSHGIEYLTRSTDKNLGAAEVVDQARRYTLNVQCYE
jgi:S1-C subfamily serine protease